MKFILLTGISSDDKEEHKVLVNCDDIKLIVENKEDNTCVIILAHIEEPLVVKETFVRINNIISNFGKNDLTII